MLPSVALLSLLAAPLAVVAQPTKDVNPFLGKNYYANSHYANELAETKAAFLKKGDALNAARVTTVQRTGTFVWVSDVAGLSGIATAISEARQEQRRTRKQQIVQLVLYDLPDRDCSAGDSAGEFSSANGGLEKYKTQFVDKFAQAVSSAPDLTFAIVVEPDSLGNVITNQAIPFCASASPVYEEGIAYAISKLQFPNVSLYIDAAHGGWLGWADNLPLGTFPPFLPHTTPLTPPSRRRVLQGPQARPDLQERRHHPRLRHRRLKLQPLHRQPPRQLHRVLALLRRAALRALARPVPAKRLGAAPLHHRRRALRSAELPRGMGRLV